MSRSAASATSAIQLPAKDHVALARPRASGLRRVGVKISGSRFVFQGHLAAGARPVAIHARPAHARGVAIPRSIRRCWSRTRRLRRRQLPKFADGLSTPRTASGWSNCEGALTNLVNDTVLDEKDLPLRFTAFTPCLPFEAGAAGKDTKGMSRQQPSSPRSSGQHRRARAVEAEHERWDGPCRGGAETKLASPIARSCCAAATWASAREDLRHRGLDARPERLSRDLELLELR